MTTIYHNNITTLFSSSGKESQTDDLLISTHVLSKNISSEIYRQPNHWMKVWLWRKLQVVMFIIWRLGFAAAVEPFGGSLQIVVVVLASLHGSLLEAFDLFTVSSVRVCTIFSHSFSSPVPTMEIRFSWPQRACETCLLVVGVCGPRGRKCDDVKQWRWHHASGQARISLTGFHP